MTTSLVLEARSVGVAFAAMTPIFSDVSFVLERGWTGLVGANGSGKTTLLRVLANEIAPHEGVIRHPPADMIAYVPQDEASLTDDVRALAERFDRKAAQLRGELLLDDEELARWPTLSPGERKRWQIAAALAREPDVLLLDEPTNHLDDDARTRLAKALARFRGIGVLVSHDRTLLEELPHTILRVHAGKVMAFAGGYSEAKSAWEGARRADEEAHASAVARVHVLEDRVSSARRTQQQIVHARSARTRMKSVRDHDARSMGTKIRVQSAEARVGRTVAVAREDLARARASIPEIERDKALGASVFATYARAPKPILFHLDEEAIVRGEHVVLRDVRLTIGRDERVRVTGANGAGKTTLLDALRSSLPQQDRILFLPQEMAPDEVQALVRDVASLPPADRGRVLSVFAALGSDPERIVRRNDGATLSPGEARKLALAFGLGKHAWALVLDEPTNHLDLPTIERLEDALDAYPGCVVMVTHDDAFARAATRRTLHVSEGLVR